ncbi:MAG: valine--tRNA ligase [Candidatus Azobacteroides pseudotrichonymphae]|jgi:valyl-tRNA synthetase|uniref:Valine--tRNA ligase n=1 Tax=Azobacteroides pseudotrichonymphae genomovar. CFP2 TaxID=511995 RepID=B6YQX5_AZOPC|nr:valine--tRNA ligase [Candidatus Azobacteroides pseudotrichonymphae]MDR0530004.1 valine--tRNA ligase [Bacteroidales bacterium OttesenSCG-928-I14]BAG83597.1 valyl-tRNA synthetase [Candidatus Azobacteroides pseudotrichonymphae genomovar. CFP2]GMO32417.1 MAG: valine--tRNA ligase [Candidatus Azobacteroides pseudotrichonymphae]
MPRDQIATKYNPLEVESKWYDYWIRKGFFHSVPDSRQPYTIVIPPPNVTGVLHMGHMLNNTIQDILVRRARMLGKNVCWVPGTDHASIATEAKVVAKLSKKGISKTNLTREQFSKYAWNWTRRHGGIILEQLKKLGASCDWERTCFTMDKQRSKSVTKVFVDLYNKGLIYRDIRMINWDPIAKTAISDEEVVYKKQKGKLYYIRYKIVGENNYAIIATTRPETIFGDTAVCIHPNDSKNAHLKGKRVIVPLAKREIPIIEDNYIDIEFGTGCLKVTPAHDINDYILCKKHGLEILDTFNDNGTLNKHGLQYEGKDRFLVRDQIEKDLEILGLMEKVEFYENKVGFSERTNVPIEPKLSMQWFLKMKNLAKPALESVMNDTILFYPSKFKNIYRHWMENVKDWNISRQLWWGHRIPAYFLPGGKFVVAETLEKALVLAKEKTGNPKLQLSDLHQDEDSLDTWFSSWLWPISVFDGVNKPHNKEIEYYYPTSDLVTGPDIIFFWVARMIMSGYEFRQKPCFHNVYFTGIVRDRSGRKMSKSLGNSPEPLDLIDRYGADGVRMGLMLSASAGNDIFFDEILCKQGRNFNNKIWNAFRLLKRWQTADIEQPESSALTIQWFESQLNITAKNVNNSFAKYRISEALVDIYKLFKDEFSAWYLEVIKPEYEQPIDKKTYQITLGFFDSLLKLLHPFIPFITEELWQSLEERKDGESIMISAMPITKSGLGNLVRMEEAKEIVSNIRTIRLQKKISNKEKLVLQIVGNYKTDYNSVIIKMSNLSTIEQVKEKTVGSIPFLVKTIECAVPMKYNIHKRDELNKLEKDLQYYRDFLSLILRKLNDENFVSKAPIQIIEAEYKKQADAESKIKSLEESIALLK